MKKLLIFLSLILFLFACTKNGTLNSPGPSADLLDKALDSTFRQGVLTWSAVTAYSYDAGKKLQHIGYDYASDSLSYQTAATYHRDSAGRTTSIEQDAISFASTSPGIPVNDTTIINVIYRPGSDQIDHLYSYHTTPNTVPGTDSIVYDYVGSAVSGTRDYMVPGLFLLAQDGFSLDNAGALTSIGMNLQDSASQEHYAFTHDGKVNPLVFGPEELGSNWLAVSPDNVTKQVYSASDRDPFTITTTYTYREDGRPLTAVSVFSNQDLVIHTTYRYQK